MHRVRVYTFDFCCFLSVAYTTLNKLFAVFFIYYIIVYTAFVVRLATRRFIGEYDHNKG